MPDKLSPLNPFELEVNEECRPGDEIHDALFIEVERAEELIEWANVCLNRWLNCYKHLAYSSVLKTISTKCQNPNELAFVVLKCTHYLTKQGML